MLKAFIFCNNNYNNFKLNIKLDGLIVASDGGANYLYQKKIIPDTIIGDCDSIIPKYLKYFSNKSEILKYPINKDKSDTELAVDYCKNKGYRDITLINAIDGQPEHSISNIFLIEKYVQDLNMRFINKDTEFLIIKDKLRVKLPVGEKISLISLSDSTCIKKTKGLKFTLNDDTLLRASSRGISNVITDNNIFIHVISGILLIIFNRMKN